MAIACLTVSLLVAAIATELPVAAAASAPYRIAVLGDSYSAGNGAGNYYGAAGCYRSWENYGEQYAQLVASSLPPGTDVQVRTEACSGATTSDYWNKKNGRPPERNALTRDTDLVLMTFGGNDLGFADIVKQCLVGATDNEKKCATRLASASNLISQGTLGAALHDLLSDASKQTRPDVKIVLIGYPYLEIDSALTFGKLPLGAKLYELSDAGDRVQRETVSGLNLETMSNRFVFVSTHDLFSGRSTWLASDERTRHELYKGAVNNARWMVHPVWDASVATTNTYYHPNPTGWTRTAALLRRTPELDPRPIVTTSVLPYGSVGGTYGTQLRTADDRPGMWSVSPTQLPPGISLTASGELNGIPTTAGTWTFTVQFTDERWGMAAIRNLKMTVGTVPASWRAETPLLPGNGASLSWMLSSPVCNDDVCALLTSYSDKDGRARIGAGVRRNGSWTATDLSAIEGYTEAPPSSSLYCMRQSDCIAAVGSQWWNLRNGAWTKLEGQGPDQWTVACGVDACTGYRWTYSPVWILHLFTYTAATGWIENLAPNPSDYSPTDPYPSEISSGTISRACGSGVCAVSTTYVNAGGQRKAVFWTWTPSAGWNVQSATFADGEAVPSQYYPVACGLLFCVVVSIEVNSSGNPELWNWLPGTGWTRETRQPSIPTAASGPMYWNASCNDEGCLIGGSYKATAVLTSGAVWAYSPSGDFSLAPDIQGTIPMTLSVGSTMFGCLQFECVFTGRSKTADGEKIQGLWDWSHEHGWQVSHWTPPIGYPNAIVDDYNFASGTLCSTSLCLAYVSPQDAESYVSVRGASTAWTASFSLPTLTGSRFAYVNGGGCTLTECVLLGSERFADPVRWIVWTSY